MKRHTNTEHHSRRRFLGRAAAAFAVPYFVKATALGADGRPAANERITMGAIGVGQRGRGDLNYFKGFKEVQFLAMCDVQRENRELAKASVDSSYRNTDCAQYVDFRKLCARDDIDAMLIATPDHWHALCSIEAMRHGKDVFCEKPLSLTIKEGRAMVDAARRYGRVFSCGSQSVHKHSKIARPVQKGELGQIHRAYVNCGGPSRPCDLPGQPVPEGMEWDLWLGPAPWAPYHPFRCGRAHGLKGEGWRTWYDYSGGMMTDFGAHHFGAAMFALGLDHTGPVEILPPRHSPLRKLTYRFVCGLEMCHGRGPGSGDGVAKYEVAEGNVPGLTWQPPTHLLERDYRGGLDNRGRVSLPGDFLHCVRTRQKPFRDVEYAHRVATVCHLGNIAYLLNRPLKWDPDKEEFVGDDEANRHTWRPMRGPWRIG